MRLANLPESIRLVEVGLRDGLQSVTHNIPTTEKVEVVHMLIDAGVKEIEAVSFAHPKVLPQLADAAEVMALVPRRADVTYRGLAPNLRGAQRAADCALDELVVVVSADNEVSRRNQGLSVDEMLDDLAEIGKLVASTDMKLVVGVACAFFAPARGEVSSEERMRIVDAAREAGASGVYLAATSGQEHPGEISEGIAQIKADHPHLELGVHLHNRNGFAPANALAAMLAGVSWLEGSFGGLGGDLWFPGDPSVLGNAAYEDLVHFCEAIGVETGVDLTKYMQVSDRIVELTGRESASFVSRGGTRSELAAAAWPENA